MKPANRPPRAICVVHFELLLKKIMEWSVDFMWMCVVYIRLQRPAAGRELVLSHYRSRLVSQHITLVGTHTVHCESRHGFSGFL